MQQLPLFFLSFFVSLSSTWACDSIPLSMFDFTRKNPAIVDSKMAFASKFDIDLTTAVRVLIPPKELAVLAHDQEFWNPLLKPRVTLTQTANNSDKYRVVVQTPTGDKIIYFNRLQDDPNTHSQTLVGVSQEQSQNSPSNDRGDVFICTKVLQDPATGLSVLALNLKVNLSGKSRFIKPLIARQISKILIDAFTQILSSARAHL